MSQREKGTFHYKEVELEQPLDECTQQHKVQGSLHGSVVLTGIAGDNHRGSPTPRGEYGALYTKGESAIAGDNQMGSPTEQRDNGTVPTKVNVEPPLEGKEFVGLRPPQLESKAEVTGLSKDRFRIENKRKRVAQQEQQRPSIDYWKNHRGHFSIPTPKNSTRTKGGTNVSVWIGSSPSCCGRTLAIRDGWLPSAVRTAVDKRNDGAGHSSRPACFSA